MKKDIKEKLKNFTIDVLDLFLGIPESIILSFDRKEFYRIMNGFPAERALTSNKIARFISNSKRSGYVTVQKVGGQESIVFTNKAKLAVVDRIAERSKIDQKYRFVSFDIPERLRKNRNQFRRVIKRLGFRQIQQSLWVSDRSIGDLVEMAANEYKIEQYIVYLVCEHTNINKELLNKLTKIE